MINSIEELFRNYHHKIYWLALSITRNEKDAEDVLQNTFIKVMRKRATFRGEASFATWLYRVAYNESLMYVRKRRRLTRPLVPLDEGKEVSSGFIVDWSKLPDEALLDEELKARIEEAVQGIPLKFRMPLLLHQERAFSLKECSLILGLTSATVKARLHRAYLMVKAELDRYFRDQPERIRHEESACGLWLGFVQGLAAGKLDRRKEHSFQRHIQDCSGCKTFLDTYRQAIRITGALECRDIPPELKAKIRSFLSPRIP